MPQIIAMGSQKITGLAKCAATGDAVARQQVQSDLNSESLNVAFQWIAVGD